MERLAEHAGVAKRTLYHHFSSKEELFDATVEAVCDSALTYLFAEYDRAQTLEPYQGMRLALSAFFDYGLAHPEVRGLLFDMRAVTPRSAAKIEDTRSRIVERIGENFRRRSGQKGRPLRVTEILAAMTVGAADHVYRQISASGDWDVDAVTDLMTELWWHAFTNIDLATLQRADKPLPRSKS
jgi:AcrR family transcriptional regulator